MSAKEAAEESIGRISAKYPDTLLGAVVAASKWVPSTLTCYPNHLLLPVAARL